MKKVNHLFYANNGIWLYLADNVELMKTIPGDTIDLTVTSPPYDNLRDYAGAIKWNWSRFKILAQELFRITKPGGVAVWVIGDATVNGSETGSSFRQALYFMKCGFNLYDTMIFKKMNPIPQSERYCSEFEYMFVLSKGAVRTRNLIKVDATYPSVRKKSKAFNFSNTTQTWVKKSGVHIGKDTKMKGNVWEYIVGGFVLGKADQVKHPAPFPYKLAKDHIISWSNKGDIVFDPFAGSGTTLKAANKMERVAVGCEISAQYCSQQVKRFTGEKEQEWENLLNGQ